MKRTTISLPDDLSAALEREARRRRVPVSAIAREAIALWLQRSPQAARRKLPIASLGRSGHRTTARDIEGLMADEWTLDRRR
jgi:predicted transcriptional regulator